MTAAYEEVAHSYPRIRRDVLFTETPDGVVFHNAHGGFNLRGRSAYRFATLVVPHLNGTNRVEQICAGLGEHQRAMVGELVGALYGRNFARDVVPGSDGLDELTPEVAERFAAQVDYIDHYVGEAGSRFRRFRDIRVAVLGDDPVARWCALSLVRNGCAALALPAATGPGTDPFAEALREAEGLEGDGCPVEVVRWDVTGGDGWDDLAGYDVVLTTGAPGAALRLLEAGVPEGVRLLPAWTFGDQAVVGPVMTAGTTGCWSCAALRLGANGEPGAAADLWSAVRLDDPGQAEEGRISGPPAAMLGNLLAYEVFRLVTGVLTPETEGRLVLQDLDSLDVVTEPLLPHPRCPHCREDEAPAAEAALTAADLTDGRDGLDARDGQDRQESPGTGSREVAPEADADEAVAALDARSVLTQTRAGVFGAFADDAWEQTPLKAGTVRLAVGHGGPREITAFDVHHVAGARLRALYRAAEVYAEHVVPQRGVVAGAALDAAREKWPLLAPDALDIASGTGAGADSVRAWVPAVSLGDARTALVPAAAVRTFGGHNHDRLFVATSAGSAAGPSPSRAAVRALYSAVAFHTLTAALRSRCPVAATAAEWAADDPEVVFLRRSAVNLGLRAELLELGGPDGLAPVMFARAQDPGTGRALWAVDAARSPREAAVGALRDLLGQAQLGRDDALTTPLDTGDPLLGDLDPMTVAVTATEEAGGGTPVTDGAGVLRRVRERGLDALVVATGSADLRSAGVHVARVLLTHGAVDAL
ncbi:TOMM precursor leader peptide-binding protein [Actinacidiphila glaucinigra]|uniref:TOMM precursor leader peptide-binding protein n=1 Tax=Actinacidiphila glaucinigra TaxID=235986 RepID=UPI0037C7E907